MDFIFSPITADRGESTLGFAESILQLQKQMEATRAKIWLFWNQVDGRERLVCIKPIKV
jgi:hypothetical protein